MALSPKESAEFISQHAKHVSISDKGIKEAAESILRGFKVENFSLKSWKLNELNPQNPSHPSTIDWIFFADTLNFSFWSEAEQCKITFHGKTYTGYWFLCAAMNRAIEEGYDILSPKFYSTVSIDTLKHIFRSDSGKEIPMLEERQKVLIETGKCLIEKFGGSFKNCVELCQNKAVKLLSLVIENFPSYRDEALYESKKVSFYKRAQILIGDIWACFEGQGLGAFHDIDELTIFADYRIPQVLVHMKVLTYSKDLYQKLEKGTEMKNGDSEEVEIRGCTIWAVELIVQKMKEMHQEIEKDLLNSVLVDHYLWEHRRKHAEEMKSTPFHKVRCIYY